MNATRIALVTLALAGTTGLLAAAVPEDSGRFLVRLGRDTTSVERYTRTDSELDIHQVGRSPRVLNRHFVYEYADGGVKKVTVTVTGAGGSVVQTIEGTADPDSFRLVIRGADGKPQRSAFILPPGAILTSSTSPWTGYESAIMRMASAKADTMSLRYYYLGAPNPYALRLRRLGRDSVEMSNDHLDVFHFRVDRTGHLLGALPISGTGKFTVTRMPTLDIEALGAAFAADEKHGAGLGALSPRDTVRTSDIAGASLWIDYSRPSARGRVIFGNVVPWGTVWRTGANAATQFHTDHSLDFGGTVVPAGFYTLWTIPSPDGWKLIVNSQTGQWGTEHDASKDLYTVNLRTETLPDPEEQFTIRVLPRTDGGVLQLDWATTRASAEFKVAP